MTLFARPDVSVLVVDSDPARLAATCAALAPAGASVLSAASVPQAMAALREQAPDLVLLEGRVGETDGLALAAAARQEVRARDLQIIVLTDAVPDPKWLARAGEAGVIDVLMRPVDARLLANKVGLVLGFLTERLRLRGVNARTEQLLRTNEQMVAGLIHDLRTPLMAINLSAEVALTRSLEESVQQAARRIRSGTLRMSRLFDHLLNLSRMGAEVPEVAWKPGNLQEVATAVVADVQRSHAGARLELTPEGDFAGVFDADLIGRALRNVITTSLDHAGPGHPVTIRLDGSHRDRLWVQVASAAVIPAEVQESLFVPGPSTAGREVPGFGLGLHHIDGFVRAHGGSMVGRSRAPDGTVFELLLPRDATAPT